MTTSDKKGLYPPTLPVSPEERIAAFNRCEYARLNEMEVTATGEGGVRVEMPVDGKRNVMGTVHGGAIFTLADHAFGIAANLEGCTEVALSASIRYLVPARGSRLAAVACREDENERSSVYRVSVYDGDRLVALFHGVSHKLQG